jgi:hypothetical protein
MICQDVERNGDCLIQVLFAIFPEGLRGAVKLLSHGSLCV